jgi:large subunit ribosomal protein L15
MLDRLEPRPGARHRRKRVGRGPGSGKGKTCGTGVKGQGTRSGQKIKASFEGGQMPLQMRLPKRGFTNRFRKTVEIVNLTELAKLGDGAEVDAELLARRGLIRDSGALVKVLGGGEAPKNLSVKVNRISASAREKIESAGGSVELIA